MQPETQAKPEVHDWSTMRLVESNTYVISPLPLTFTPIKDAADFYETDTTTTEEGIDTYAPSVMS